MNPQIGKRYKLGFCMGYLHGDNGDYINRLSRHMDTKDRVIAQGMRDGASQKQLDEKTDRVLSRRNEMGLSGGEASGRKT